jgi:hypothetical protein
VKTKLPNGTKGFYREDGSWQCTGAAMGRSNAIPDRTASPKLHLYRLAWVDGDYDQGGAYWGNSGHDGIYRAEGEAEGVDERYDIYVRSGSRDGAKELIREMVPQARFFS